MSVCSRILHCHCTKTSQQGSSHCLRFIRGHYTSIRHTCSQLKAGDGSKPWSAGTNCIGLQSMSAYLLIRQGIFYLCSGIWRRLVAVLLRNGKAMNRTGQIEKCASCEHMMWWAVCRAAKCGESA